MKNGWLKTSSAPLDYMETSNIRNACVAHPGEKARPATFLLRIGLLSCNWHAAYWEDIEHLDVTTTKLVMICETCTSFNVTGRKRGLLQNRVQSIATNVQKFTNIRWCSLKTSLLPSLSTHSDSINNSFHLSQISIFQFQAVNGYPAVANRVSKFSISPGYISEIPLNLALKKCNLCG